MDGKQSFILFGRIAQILLWTLSPFMVFLDKIALHITLITIIPFDTTLMTSRVQISFERTQRVLCLQCGDFGHRAGTCVASSLSKPSCTFIVNWKDNKLILVKTGKHICITYNVHGSCNDESNSLHGKHICSLCAYLKHTAIACTRN